MQTMAEHNTTPNNNKSDSSETVKSIIYFMLALLVFIIFKPTFEGLYKSIFVELFDVFNIKNFTLKQSYFTLLSWLALNVIATSYVFYLIWKNYRLSLNSYLIGLFSLLLFVFYRYFDTTTFIFYPIGTDIKFADFSLVYFVLGFVLFFRNYYRKKVSKQDIYKNDLPTNTDTLGRNHASDHLAGNILSNYSEKAFAIGIMGTWGTGKTTFLEFIKNSLKTKSKEQTDKVLRLVMIDFNPWFSKKPEQITQDFFDSLNNKIGEYSGELSDEITSYAQKLVTAKEGIIISILKEVFNIFASKETPSELYDKINKTLQKLNLKLVIFIDDLDRLDKREIVEVLRIIRNTANFHNTVFVVAYDRNYVINAIKDINDHNKERYLEKIFQLEIALPYTETKTIINQLQEWLERWIKNHIATDLQEELLNGEHGLYKTLRNKIVEDFIITMRDASRFYNLFITEYHNNVRGEILLEHFILIKLLLFKYPSVYELIVAKKDTFLYRDGDYFVDRDNLFMKYLEKNKIFLLISEQDIKVILSIFRLFFLPGRNYWKAKKNYLFINYYKSFSRYFANSIMGKQLKESVFTQVNEVNYIITDLVDYIDYIDDFEKRYKGYDKKRDGKHTIKVLLALYYYNFCVNEILQPTKNTDTSLFDYMYELNRISNQEFIEFLNYIFLFKYNENNEKKHLCFNACVAYFIYNKIIEKSKQQHYEIDIRGHFSEDTLVLLKEQCVEALGKAITEGKYENPDYLIMLYDYNYNITKVINEGFIKHIAENHADFMLKLIDYNDDMRFSGNAIVTYFGSYERFEKFLNDEIEATELVVKYRKAYQDLKERGLDRSFNL